MDDVEQQPTDTEILDYAFDAAGASLAFLRRVLAEYERLGEVERAVALMNHDFDRATIMYRRILPFYRNEDRRVV
jgi:hypothetical protein